MVQELRIEGASGGGFVSKGGHDPRQHPRAELVLKTPMTGLKRGVSVGKIGPGRASS
jgi:hypothetical protein